MVRGGARFTAVALAATLAMGMGLEAPVSAHQRTGAQRVTAPETAASISLTAARNDLLRLLNQTRRTHHLRPVKLHPQVSRVALRHSRQMARAGKVTSSTNLPGAIRRWLHGAWGENVTCGTSPWTIHRAFLHDKDARANILRAKIRFAGIGVARSDPKPRACSGGSLWVTEILFV